MAILEDMGKTVKSGIETALESATQIYNEKTYNGMINSADKYYDEQIKASDDWAKKQSQLQQERTDFTIDKIEQEKAQSEKDYTKEQSGAYVDWQKQSNQYGANAEQMAASGLTNSGFSESSQVSMYNAYQNRVAVAREANVIAMQNFDNAITEAQLQNSSTLAEIAYKAQQEQLELNMKRFQYRNTLLLDIVKSKREIEQTYHNSYQSGSSGGKSWSSGSKGVVKKWSSGSTSSNKGSSSGFSVGSNSGSNSYISPLDFEKKDAEKQTMDSITALGLGRISESELNELVKSGKVIEYTENGVTKYSWNKNYRPKSVESNVESNVEYEQITDAGNSLIPPKMPYSVLKR